MPIVRGARANVAAPWAKYGSQDGGMDEDVVAMRVIVDVVFDSSG